MDESHRSKESFVYVGITGAPSGDFYVKVGKSNNPWKRRDDYFTHCPGGLASMYAARCSDSAAALTREFRLRTSIRSLPQAQNVGGEWTRVPSSRLDDVFRLLELTVGPAFTVECLRHRRFA